MPVVNLPVKIVMDKKKIIMQTQQWLTDVIVGLNLCPFAKRVVVADTIRFTVSESTTAEQLLEQFVAEVELLNNVDLTEVETTVLIVPEMFAEFDDYNQFLDLLDQVLLQFNWQGVFQVASFHPYYCFAGAHPDDNENLTNRSPYPILHILREGSVAKAIAQYPDVDKVPERNIKRVAGLSDKEKQLLFPYLFAVDS
ncbi:MAG: hypothetical protein ACJA0M_000215 [Chitinophagales bacterium]|jgi:hypothetical protein